MPRESTYNAVKQFPRVLLSYRLYKEERNASIYPADTNAAPSSRATFHVRPSNARVFPKTIDTLYTDNVN